MVSNRRGFIINLPQPQQNKNCHFAPMCNVQVAQFSNNTNRANQATDYHVLRRAKVIAVAQTKHSQK